MSSFPEDIGIFQQPSFSSAESWDTGQTPVDDLAAVHDHLSSPAASLVDTFNSQFSESTSPQPSHCILPDPTAQSAQAFQQLPDVPVPDPDIPAIISQDPNLVASWRFLFAQASRPPTNLEGLNTKGPKDRQEYLNLIKPSPNIPFGDSMSHKRAFCKY